MRKPTPVGRRACRLTLILLALALVFTAGHAYADIKLPQAEGAELVLATPVQRIVTLAPNLAELVFAAGAADKLVGVVAFSNYPAPARNIPRVGDAFRIDLEGVLALDPDLVIAWPSGNPPDALEKLEKLGLTVWRIEITTPEEIASSMAHIARAAGREHHGQAAAERLSSRLQALRRVHSGKPPVSYFYQVSARPLYTVNGSHIISRGLALCGAQNVFASLAALAPQVSREAVVAADPMAMIAPRGDGSSAELASWKNWPGMRAVRHNALLYLPADSISQATPRLLDSLETACKLIDGVRSAMEAKEE